MSKVVQFKKGARPKGGAKAKGPGKVVQMGRVARAEKTAEKPRGLIGARIRELLATRADLTSAQIAEIVQSEFPRSRPTRGSVSTYATYMRRDLKGPQPARDAEAR